MLAYKMKNVKSTECASEKYICVNNLGYRETTPTDFKGLSGLVLFVQ